MDHEVTLQWDRFNALLDQRIATSSRDALVVASEQLRGLHRQLIKITPPGHSVSGSSVEGGTRDALDHGRAKVAGDIAKVYGTASSAYDAIYEKSPSQARAFYALRTRNPTAAADIVRAQLNTWYGPFDGGVLHQRNFRGGSVKGKKSKPILYIQHSDRTALEAYVKKQQGHVMYLTSGWNAIMTKLGIPLPAFTALGGEGTALIEVSTSRIHAVASNDVKYASNTITRLQWAIDQQSGAMQRQWDDWNTKRNNLFISM